MNEIFAYRHSVFATSVGAAAPIDSRSDVEAVVSFPAYDVQHSAAGEAVVERVGARCPLQHVHRAVVAGAEAHGLHGIAMRFTHLALVLVPLLGLAALSATPEASAAEAAPGCLGLGVGLLNPYFDLPWSNGEKAKFAGLIRQPSVAAYWGVERQNETGDATTRFGAQGGIDVRATGTAAAIFQPVQAPKLVPGFSYVLIDVLARVFVKRG